MTLTAEPGSALEPERLAAACTGAVLTPADDGYAEACAGWNLAFEQRPAIVVVAADADDVAAAMRHAAAHGLGVAVQATGHSPALVADGRTLLISTRALDAVRIDPEARTATVGGGAVWLPVLEAAQQHGLAPLLGSAGDVGAVGFSLGGGIGWLARRHGLAVDRVRELRVVLADGRLVTASRTEEPELFWALRGSAGSALGVAVEMTIELVPVATVVAGSLWYPIELAAEAFARYREWTSRAPVELTSAFAVIQVPPLDIMPEPMRGRAYVEVLGCWAGDPGDDVAPGVALVDEWRRWREPEFDLWFARPFVEQTQISMDPPVPVPVASDGFWLRELDDGVVGVLLEAVLGGPGPSPMIIGAVRHAGGAVATPNPEASFAGRDGEWLIDLIGIPAGPPGAAAEIERRIVATRERFASLLAPLPGYANFAEGERRAGIAAAACAPATRERLAAAKRRYDPENLLRHGVRLE